MSKYTIGIDFGTLSGRALLVNVATGEELASATYPYPHGVMDKELANGMKLPPDWALQHPLDYLDVLRYTIPTVIKDSGVAAKDIIGVGIDFTACTLLPIKKDGIPLCFLEEFKEEVHSYVKLWKHHAAQDKANLINETAKAMNQDFLSRYGGTISSEWLLPKIWQVLDEAPHIYEEADYFIEAGDWIVWQLCGVHTRNSCAAGYKAIWDKAKGYPDKEFLRALDKRLESLVEDKLNCQILPLGTKAGEITRQAAELYGLEEGTAVAVANVDAHVTMPAVGIDGPNKMLAIIGTSTCHMMLDKEEHSVPGICGVVEDGIYPGFYGYEAGQPCVGDSLAWFVNNCISEEYVKVANIERMDIHQYLSKKAQGLRVGQSGLLALDWWNGNRSVLVDADLTGLILGMTLQTRPEEIYRALIEATAFGTKAIIDNFRENGVAVNEFYASGGISYKNPMIMQIYADVIDLPIKIGGSLQGPALGSAIFGAVAAGSQNGGYDDIFEASRHMGKLDEKVYYPIPEHVEVYKELYKEYKILHDYFGRGQNKVMKRLKEIKNKAFRNS